MTTPTLRATGLTKLRGGKKVLDNVDLTLRQGSVTAILGPSGAGKSTLLRAIAGLEDLNSGTIESDTRVLTDGAALVLPENRNIGMVFQDFSLFPHLSVIDNVLFGLRSGSVAERRDRALAMLEQVHLSARAEDYPHMLSGGEQQRIALARALAPAPDTILLDEAFSGLDGKLRAELRDTALAAIAAQGAAALMVTHDAEEAMYMADTLALMIDGRIVQTGAPAELYLNPVSASAARLLGEINEWDGPVENGKLQTPFGAIEAASSVPGRGKALVRPEGMGISLNPNGNCKAQEIHPLGANLAIRVEGPGQEVWLAKATIESPIKAGDRVEIKLNPHFCTIVCNA
ncbi:ABC transporter ATP-binding protein [Pontixanthobacter aestiaquae]|uniref:ATP-binding cassette domain-containing protein n=1 Tax=Pontixanthobacter aestiaquae TaxID=1509367 RepID=A0A844Z3B8_9SPHN|nr:ABC transporter ATP-binding protein [Pontixanthobacter aestiaquae]MDN3647268.1 ABC transporter ATP-binding protein [Pontixanthobacter aestiaquae]MXO81756.1 ATP-binding cassette domain-containing protein [Pontixanthobacter aestiaquae]